MSKSPDAFRTISEVAEWLGIQAHVLRFWESKFTQVKPVKRAGGRRYYRPNDMLLLGGIKQLLHEDGLTIKGVQKILREEGMGHVIAMSPPLDEITASELAEANAAPPSPIVEDVAPEPETGVVLSFGHKTEAEAPAAPQVEQPVPEAEVEAEPELEMFAPAEEAGPEPAQPESPSVAAETDAPADAAPQAQPDEDTPAEEAPTAPPAEAAAEDADEAPTEAATEDADAAPAAHLPAFLRRPMADAEPEEAAQTQTEAAEAPPAEPEAPAPKPRNIPMPAITPLDDITAAPSVLSAAHGVQRLSTAQAKEIAPLLEKLAVLRDSMAARRPPSANS